MLEYRARDDEEKSANPEEVIAIVHRTGLSELCIRVHSDWRSIARREDQPVLKALFDDFKERARLDSGNLLRQLSTLGVGPLVTCEAGQNLFERPDLLLLFERFEDI